MSIPKMNRQWLLVRRPEGAFSPKDLEYHEEPVPGGALRDGEIIVRNLCCLCAPTIRTWMGARARFQPSIALGSPVLGPTIARVLHSANPAYPVGRLLLTMSGWQDIARIDTARAQGQLIVYPVGLTPVECLGALGVNALTAYFGLLRVGAARAGESLLVSAASGSTGSMVCQIGRIAGCRVVGLARGREKTAWVKDSLGVDAVIDIQGDDLDAGLREHFPDGIDIFFDNVGGSILASALDQLASRGRVVLCGQISEYEGARRGARVDTMRLVYGQQRIEGFLVAHYFEQAGAAIEDLRAWKAAGRLIHREDVREGFAALPSSFADMFSGATRGTLIVRIASET